MAEYCSKNLPRWNFISISGYHIREAGSTAAQEIGFTMANAIEYVNALVNRGLAVDSFAPRLSWHFQIHNNFFEEVAKLRALRRMWARIMKERFERQDPRSLMFRTHVQTGGVTLTAQQPLNNISRATIQALAAALGGVQSMAVASYDEAICIPTEEASTQSLTHTANNCQRERHRRCRRPHGRQLLPGEPDQPGWKPKPMNSSIR